MRVQSEKVWIADQFAPAVIEAEDGKITRILPYGSREVDEDYGSLRIVPGFLDLHCHGAYGFDTNDADEKKMRNWTERIVEEGVTGFLATTITQSEEVLTAAAANVAKVMEDGYEGAEILGIHLEGPFLNPAYCGAQPAQYLIKPSVRQFERFQKAAKGRIKYVTIAPETDEDFILTRYLAAHGVRVSIGHSAATYEQAFLAFANGACSMTHVYNGMTLFRHRENGLVGAAYRFRTMYGEIICDGVHSTAAALNNFFLSKGPDYAMVVSDALMTKGSPAGSRYFFGGNEIETYPDGSAHLVSTGGLAGSSLKINEGLRFLTEEAMIPFNYALNACTLNPAKCLGIEERKGQIRAGCDADLVVLGTDYQVLQTYCKGKAQRRSKPFGGQGSCHIRQKPSDGHRPPDSQYADRRNR